MKHLIIAGAGEFGRELYWTIQGARGFGIEFDIKGYIDDMPNREKTNILQAPCFGTIDGYEIINGDIFACAIASPAARERVIKKLLQKGAEFIDIIHETAILHGTVTYGEGLIMSPYSILGDRTAVGEHVVLNTFSAVGHDCTAREMPVTAIYSSFFFTSSKRIGWGSSISSICCSRYATLPSRMWSYSFSSS